MFCKKCGKDIGDSLYCPDCGTYNGETNNNSVSSSGTIALKKYDPEQTVLVVAKVFLILGMVIQGIAIIPLIWVLPVGLTALRKIKNANSAKELVGIAIASLILVSLVGGILMLCAKDED